MQAPNSTSFPVSSLSNFDANLNNSLFQRGDQVPVIPVAVNLIARPAVLFGCADLCGEITQISS
jgi:hypothetical protein